MLSSLCVFLRGASLRRPLLGGCLCHHEIGIKWSIFLCRIPNMQIALFSPHLPPAYLLLSVYLRLFRLRWIRKTLVTFDVIEWFSIETKYFAHIYWHTTQWEICHLFEMKMLPNQKFMQNSIVDISPVLSNTWREIIWKKKLKFHNSVSERSDGKGSKRWFPGRKSTWPSERRIFDNTFFLRFVSCRNRRNHNAINIAWIDFHFRFDKLMKAPKHTGAHTSHAWPIDCWIKVETCPADRPSTHTNTSQSA